MHIDRDDSLPTLATLVDQRTRGILDKQIPTYKGYSIPRSYFKARQRDRLEYIWISTLDNKRSLKTTKIHVLGALEPPPEISQILSLGGSFIPTPAVFRSTREIARCTNQTFVALQRSIVLREKHGFEPDPDFDPRFHVKSKKVLVPPIRLHTLLAAVKTQFELFNENAIQARRQNLSRARMRRLEAYQLKHRLIIKQADKNVGLTVMSEGWYLYQIRKHLATEFYQVIGDVETFNLQCLPEIKKQQKAVVAMFIGGKDIEPFTFGIAPRRDGTTFNRSSCVTRQVANYLRPSKLDFTTFPQFHVLPKIHKFPATSRPIVPTFDWGTTRLSQYLSVKLAEYVSAQPWILKDTQDLVKRLQSLELYPKATHVIVTGDVKSLYTNIPQEDGCRLVKEWLRTEHDVEFRELNGYLAALCFIMNTNYFQDPKGTVYKQVIGTAMGTNVAPEYANLYLAAKEAKCVRLLKTKYEVEYYRYLDDILIIVQDDNANYARNLMRLAMCPLEVVFTEPLARQSFLDLDITIKRTEISFETFRKPINVYQYMPWSSCHPISTKQGFVFGETKRIIRTCSTYEARLKHVGIFYNCLRARGYPPGFCMKWITKGFTSEPRDTQNRKPPPIHLMVKYNELWETNTAGGFRSTIDGLLGDHFAERGTMVGFSKSREKNIGDKLNGVNKRILGGETQSQ